MELRTVVAPGKKTHLLRHFYTKTMISPRQARDKTEGKLKKEIFSYRLADVRLSARGGLRRRRLRLPAGCCYWLQHAGVRVDWRCVRGTQLHPRDNLPPPGRMRCGKPKKSRVSLLWFDHSFLFVPSLS
jgi:hypothetical protein